MVRRMLIWLGTRECAAHTTPCWLREAQHTPATQSHTACSARASSRALPTKGSAHASLGPSHVRLHPLHAKGSAHAKPMGHKLHAKQRQVTR